MNIYSFEFGTQRVNWYFNEYKNMNFLATRSRRFPGAQTFVRLDSALSEEIVVIRNGSWHKPAILLPEEYHLINHNETMNVQLLLNNPAVKQYALAFVIIDSDEYRMVNYDLALDTTSEDLPDDVSFPEIRKVCIGEKTQAAIFQFRINQELDQVVPLIMYNKIDKKYEYWSVYVSKDSLHCNEMEGDDVKEALKEWEKYDIKNGRREKFFRMEIFQPVTKYFVTKESKYDEMIKVLEPFTSGAKHRKFLAIPDSEIKYTEKVLDMVRNLQDGKRNATTFYGFNPNIPDRLRDKAPLYNFIMSETGKVTGI